MKFIINNNLTDKIDEIKSIGVDEDNGLIMGICEDDKIIPMNQEILELAVLSLLDRKREVVVMGRTFILEVRQVSE